MRPASLALISLAWLLASCSRNQPGVYDLTGAEALQRLREADLPGFIAARGCGVVLDIAMKADAPNVRRWIIRGEGAELAHFSVRIDDAGGGKVRAQLDVPANPASPATLRARSGATALRQPLQGAAVELVDAALGGRSFDPDRVGDDRPQVEACKAVTDRPSVAAESAPADRRARAFGAPMVNAEQASSAAASLTSPVFGQQLEDRPEAAR